MYFWSKSRQSRAVMLNSVSLNAAKVCSRALTCSAASCILRVTPRFTHHHCDVTSPLHVCSLMLVMQQRGYNPLLYEELWCIESVRGQSGLIYPAGGMCDCCLCGGSWLWFGWTITERCSQDSGADERMHSWPTESVVSVFGSALKEQVLRNWTQISGPFQIRGFPGTLVASQELYLNLL